MPTVLPYAHKLRFQPRRSCCCCCCSHFAVFHLFWPPSRLTSAVLRCCPSCPGILHVRPPPLLPGFAWVSAQLVSRLFCCCWCCCCCCCWSSVSAQAVGRRSRFGVSSPCRLWLNGDGGGEGRPLETFLDCRCCCRIGC